MSWQRFGNEKRFLGMYLQALTEHQVHLFGGVIVLAALFFGIIWLVTYLDKRGVKTYVPNRQDISRRERKRVKKKSTKSNKSGK